MSQPITKRLRMSKRRAARLARLAKRLGKAESALLREGMDLLEERERRLAGRRAGIEGLIRMIEGPEPKKIRWKMKY